MNKKLLRFYFALIATSISIFASAQWTANTFLNTPCTTLGGSVTPLVASTNTGQTYVSYYWPDSNYNYTLYLQLLDKQGNLLLGPNGVVVCNKPSGTAVYLYDLKVDGSGNAIIGAQFIDTVSQTDSIFVNKFSPSGTPLWNAGGVTLAAGLAPTLCVTPDNNIIVESRGSATMWKLNGSNGQFAWAQPDTFDSKVTNCELVTTPTNDFIAVYFLTGGNFQYGTLYAMKYDSNGFAKWDSAVQVTNQTAAVFDAIQAVPDSTGGFYLALTSYSAFNQDVFAQHINTAGIKLWGDGGVEVCNVDTILKFMGGLAYSQSLQSLFVLSSTTDLNQVYYGINLQKLDTAGVPKFTAIGLQTQAVDSATTAGGLVLEDSAVAYIYTNDSSQIKADKLDFNGNFVWQQRWVCTNTNSKSNPGLTLYKNRQFVAVWEDDGTNAPGIYAQSLIDTVVDTTTAIQIIGAEDGALRISAFPNPSAHNQLNLKFIVTETQNLTVFVTDLAGNTIYKTAFALSAGEYIRKLNLPAISSGMYLVEIQTQALSRSLKWICSE